MDGLASHTRGLFLVARVIVAVAKHEVSLVVVVLVVPSS